MTHAPRAVGGLVALTLLATPAAASAHTSLESSDPAPGARLQIAPSEVELTFSGELEPDGSGFVVTDASGAEAGTGELDLAVADRNVLRGRVTITQAGAYRVAWAATAPDGHQESGAFSFVIIGSEGAAPDTALETSEPDGGTAVGAVLVGLAGVAALRRMRGAARP